MPKRRKAPSYHDGRTERTVLPIYGLCKGVPDNDGLLAIPEQLQTWGKNDAGGHGRITITTISRAVVNCSADLLLH